MKRIIYLFIAAVVLSLVPVTNVMGQVKPRKPKTTKRVKPTKRHEVVKEDTDLLTEEEMIERMGTKTRIEVSGGDRFSERDAEDARRLTTDRIELSGSSKEDNKIFDVVEQQPTFSEGNPAAWLSKHTVYPTEAVGSGIDGRVTVGFVVEKNGTISNVRVLRGVDPSLDKEAVRVVKSMPKWNPGMQNGEPVRVNYTVPVIFKKP